MKQNKPIVTITQVGVHWEWFQVFILGFYELERNKQIKLKFRCEWPYRLSTCFPENYLIGGALRSIKNIICKETFNLLGTIEFNGKESSFCIDCADAPYMFSSKCLQNVDAYFKINCPKEINIEKGFRLTDDVTIPYVDHEKVFPNKIISPRKTLTDFDLNLHKIKPLLQSFRSLARLNSYWALKKGYDNYKRNAISQPSKKLMCYFGNAYGPKPNTVVKEPDWNSEADIMGLFKEKLNHPNEKRARVARIISSKGDKYDARIISEGDPDDKKAIRHDELIVPISDFCSFVSNFEYNFNVSGYRLSIPSRFIESFIVGTAIITDKLSVKWYLPFEEEVIETAEMGYLPENQVDWDKVTKDIDCLPRVNKERIIELFEKKWAPIRVAEYIVRTVLNG